MKKNVGYSIVILSLLITVISCKRTTIEGKIIDGFGKPVKGATVKVAGTQFTSQTDASGEYSVGYVPGNIKVLITKEGFTDTSFSVTIATESIFPAETTSIFEIPKEIGIFVMQDGGYVPLTKGEVSHNTVNIEKL